MSNVYDIELQRYKNLKIRVCGKDSIPLSSIRLVTNFDIDFDL